jgi:hypothetical protein
MILKQIKGLIMNNDELIKEFLENGGEIEVLPPQEYEVKNTIGSVCKKVPQLKTLEEGKLLYTKKKTTNKKKEIDLSDIDMSLIPDELHKLVGYNVEKTKEDDIETN